MRVRKAVFPAAGWGTRFLPATKAQPKEMLPLVDKPVIQYAVEEAVAAGIEQALREHAQAAIAEIEAAARHASEAGRESAIQLRDQLAAVNELTANLERRV